MGKKRTSSEVEGDDLGAKIASHLKAAGSEMSLKALKKAVGSELEKKEFKSAAKAAAKASGGAFVVDGKIVRLAAATPAAAAGAAVIDAGTAEPEKAAKKAKKAKKESKASGGGGGGGAAAEKELAEPANPKTAKWREENLVQVSEEVEPAFNFKDKRLPQNVVQASCSTFTKPSAIQVMLLRRQHRQRGTARGASPERCTAKEPKSKCMAQLPCSFCSL